MPQVLVDGATVQCSHSGMVSLSGGNTMLSVSGSGAITAGMEVGISFAQGAPGVTTPCPIKNLTSGAPTPCTIVAPASAGASTLLSVGGTPVLLDSAQGQTVNATTGPVPWSVADPGQQLLSVSG
jgi:hypothetical protein